MRQIRSQAKTSHRYPLHLMKTWIKTEEISIDDDDDEEETVEENKSFVQKLKDLF